MADEILLRYQGRLTELEAGVAQARSQGSVAGLVLAAAMSLFLVACYYAVGHRLPVWTVLIPVPVVIGAERRYRTQRQARYRSWRLTQHYRRAVERIQGDWPGTGSVTGADGEEFRDPDHPCSNDLNLFGEGSLFELLCVARTANGRRGLAQYLLETPPMEEVRLRQEAVRELTSRADLREQTALLGKFDFSESKRETFDAWLASPIFQFSVALQTAALITSSLVAILVLGGAFALIGWPQVGLALVPLLGFHAAVGLAFRERVNGIAAVVRPVSIETGMLRAGLQLMENATFQCSKLRQLSRRVRNSADAVKRLDRLLDALHERNKEWFYIPSLCLLAGTQLCMAIEQWRASHSAELQAWLDAWAEFEALNAVGNYAFENPENTYPELCGSGAIFQARSLGHPLLPNDSCVRNDVELNAACRFYVVSGSNMSGKSTLLRAVGLNVVLAYGGAPVRAQQLRLSRLSVCASLSVVDSLLNGKSKFLAEIDRLSLMLTRASQGESVLFLIDEILSGTNSRDRHIASEAIVRTLLARGAIGALSTHDLALTAMAELSELKGANVHMGAKASGAPLAFDYLLKRGVTQEANALAIARMAGVPV
jgi:hypothetical protein